MCMPGFEWTGPTISVSFSAIGSTKQRISHSSSCDRAGAQSQGGQLLSQHNTPNCGSHSMEPLDSRWVFVCWLFGKIAVMGRTAWPEMGFLLRDLFQCFLPDRF